MKAMIQDRYGPPEILALLETDKPSIKDGEVLVRVRAASVNPPDWAAATGVPYVARLATGLRKPRNRIRGSDVAGIVEAVGRDVRRLRIGDEVFGSGAGTFAEYAVAPEKNLVPKPANVTFEQAAAVPMAGLVAIQVLRKVGNVQPGQKVLINGAGGGIGTFAVQIARSFGAEVTGVCSTNKVDLVRSIGAGHVIDYTKEDFTQGDERYDFILDNVSRQSLSRLRRALAPKGILVPNGGRFDKRWTASLGIIIRARLLSLFVGRKLRPFLSLPNQEDLAALADLLASGKVTPVIGATYTLGNLPEAIRYFGEGHARGKVVVVV